VRKTIISRVPTIKTSQKEKTKEESFEISEIRLVELTPSYIGKTYKETIEYDRIRTENLNLKMFSRILEKENVKSFDLTEDKEFFVYRYAGRPKVYISKKDGRIYSEVLTNEANLQASILLRILAKYNIVFIKRLQKHKEPKIVWG